MFTTETELVKSTHVYYYTINNGRVANEQTTSNYMYTYIAFNDSPHVNVRVFRQSKSQGNNAHGFHRTCVISFSNR